jgi:sugar/nucleoside kinase (ribokinase family)
MRKGLLVGGNFIIDQVKVIDAFPEEEKLVNITSEYTSNGGSAYNILKNIVKLKGKFPLYGVGLVGNDKRGERILRECLEMGIDTSQVLKKENVLTSYTDVMSAQLTGKRTFFHQRGANAFLDIQNFRFSLCNAKIFHLGYLLLLDKLDTVEADGKTRAAKVLNKAQKEGFITSADVVSEESNRYKSVIPSSLEFIDYFFINEFEAGRLTGFQTLTEEKTPLLENCYKAAAKIIDMGVNQWVIVHFPSGAIALSRKGEKFFQPSLKIPSDKIKGAVGAGDAFASGVLFGIHDNQKMNACLKLGVCAAASSLFAATSSDGIVQAEECLSMIDIYGFGNEIT